MTKLIYIGKCLLIETGKKDKKERKKILVIGDLHLGYEQALNEGGVFVSRKMYDEMILELDKVFKIAEMGGKVDEVVLVGDVKQEFRGILRQERGDIIGLVNWLLEKTEKLVITRGNHDSILEPILRGKERIELREVYCADGVVFAHGDKNLKDFWNKETELIVMGHWHPAVEFIDGVKKERYKCFLEGKTKGKTIVILPSFIDNREGIDIRHTDFEEKFNASVEKFKVRVVNLDGEMNVFDFGQLGKITG
jgi:putative SbcD/Mre11-related phosphoesterase